MIRVNLLPEVKSPRRRTTAKGPRAPMTLPIAWIAGGVVIVLIFAAGLGVFHMSLQKEAKEIQAEIAQYQSDIKKLKLDVEKVERVKRQRNELNNKLAVIEKLKSAQKGPVHLLDQLASSIPPKVWLTSVSENGASMVIDGKAADHINIAQFMQRLEKSPFFSQVELSEAISESTSSRNSIPTKEFHLSCKIDKPADLM